MTARTPLRHDRHIIVTPYDSLPSTPPPDAGAQAALNLRPLSLGELLDRAFNLYFKNIAAFTALVAVVIVPSTLISYFQSRDMLGFYIDMIQHAMQSPNSPPDLSKINSLMPSDTWLFVQYALLFLGFPFAYGAVVAGVSRAYLGLPVLFADSYRFALRRWFAILILLIVWVIVGFVLAIAVALLVIFAAAILAVVGRTLGANSFFNVSLIVVVIGSMIAGVGLAVMLYLTSAMSFIAVVIEGVDPVIAFGGAFARMFSAQQFWRGFLLALALTAINLGFSLVTAGAGAVLAYLLKTPAIYLIAVGLTSLFFAPFAVVTAAVFYYDVRIRREGYDLQMLANRFTSPPPPAASST
jgi:hypothetical protein